MKTNIFVFFDFFQQTKQSLLSEKYPRPTIVNPIHRDERQRDHTNVQYCPNRQTIHATPLAAPRLANTLVCDALSIFDPMTNETLVQQSTIIIIANRKRLLLL